MNEGDNCKFEGCGGKMIFGEVENCFCHIIPPCSNCTNLLLECSECGCTEDDFEKLLEVENEQGD